MTPAEALAATARALDRLGLNAGTSGNVSVRTPDGFLVTPSAVAAERLTAEQMVAVDPTGRVRSTGIPSTEWRIHRDVYRHFPAAGGIVHTHSTYATALAALREDLPPFHYLVAKSGGDAVRCAAYATFGTQALSDAVIEALGDRRACLMANHGMLTYGRDLDDALALAVDIETLCRQYLVARSAGTPVLLDASQLAEAREGFSRYGRPPEVSQQP